jgi:phosphoenolpyruvate carboxykinase (ATP)
VKQTARFNPANDVADLGISGASAVHYNLTEAQLYQSAIERHEGLVVVNGPLAVTTGQHTGRSARDKFFVRDARPKTPSGGTTAPRSRRRTSPRSSATCSPT